MRARVVFDSNLFCWTEGANRAETDRRPYLPIGSFRFLSRSTFNAPLNFDQRLGIHHAFDSTGGGQSADHTNDSESRCSDTMIIVPVPRTRSSGASARKVLGPAFDLFNPLLIDTANDPPFPDFEPRKDFDPCAEHDAAGSDGSIDRSPNASSGRTKRSMVSRIMDSDSEDTDYVPDEYDEDDNEDVNRRAVVPSSNGSDQALFTTGLNGHQRHRTYYRKSQTSSSSASKGNDTNRKANGHITTKPIEETKDPLDHLPSLHAWPPVSITAAVESQRDSSDSTRLGLRTWPSDPNPAAASKNAITTGLAAAAATATSTRRKRLYGSHSRAGSAPAPTSASTSRSSRPGSTRLSADHDNADNNNSALHINKLAISPGGGRWVVGVGGDPCLMVAWKVMEEEGANTAN